MSTKIAWADEVWNPVIGCTKVSSGCQNCYAVDWAYRLAKMGNLNYNEVVYDASPGPDPIPQWTGSMMFVGSAFRSLGKMSRTPRRIFVCSMGDLFHRSVPDSWIDEVMDAINLHKHHTFMILTKRSERLRKYMNARPKVLDNLWVGVTAENQQDGEYRVHNLMHTNAALRFVSVEPMIGTVDLRPFLSCEKRKLGWVICGCESGKGRRPMRNIWAYDLLNQCHEAGVPFFMKQKEVDGKVSKDIDDFPSMMKVRQFPRVG